MWRVSFRDFVECGDSTFELQLLMVEELRKLVRGNADGLAGIPTFFIKLSVAIYSAAASLIHVFN